MYDFMKIVSNRDSLHEMSNSLLDGKIRKVSSNILSAELAQRVVKVRGTSNFCTEQLSI